MEFPHLGSHCSESSCNQLDFLPLRCDACERTFCRVHYLYAAHACPEAYRRDNQVPACPLCGKPVPMRPGDTTPDARVGAHIDTDCQSEPAREHRGKVYRNRCARRGCRTRELVPLLCRRCGYNFCIAHRNEIDHACGTGLSAAAANRKLPGFNNAGAAAGKSQPPPPENLNATTKRPENVNATTKRPENLNAAAKSTVASMAAAQARVALPPTSAADYQGGLSDAEALARALRESQATTDGGREAAFTHLQQGGLSDGAALVRAMNASKAEAAAGGGGNNVSRAEQEELDRQLAEALSQQSPAPQGVTETSRSSSNCRVS